MTAGAEGKPVEGGSSSCSPCCSNGGNPEVSPVLPVKPLYGPEKMRPVAGQSAESVAVTRDEV